MQGLVLNLCGKNICTIIMFENEPHLPWWWRRGFYPQWCSVMASCSFSLPDPYERDWKYTWWASVYISNP